MHKKLKLSVLLLLSLSTAGVFAQEATITAGGDATGAGGSVSYSVGQALYTTNAGTNGSEAQGVQQPYEISTTVGIELTNINLELSLSVYPNPTTDYLTLKVKDIELSTLNFQLYDINGKRIESGRLTDISTTIDMESQPTSTYFLKVTDGNTRIKMFKIIKN